MRSPDALRANRRAHRFRSACRAHARGCDARRIADSQTKQRSAALAAGYFAPVAASRFSVGTPIPESGPSQIGPHLTKSPAQHPFLESRTLKLCVSVARAATT